MAATYTYTLVVAQAGLLPASYPLDITATPTDNTISPLTQSFSITVTGVAPPTQDTVRTLTDLLTNIWRDGQIEDSLTVQDVRDTIISLALQTGDFSRLPTSPTGLANGLAYIDQGVIRVNLTTGSSSGRAFSAAFSSGFA